MASKLGESVSFSQFWSEASSLAPPEVSGGASHPSPTSRTFTHRHGGARVPFHALHQELMPGILFNPGY